MTTRSLAPIPNEQAVGRAVRLLAKVVADVARNRRVARPDERESGQATAPRGNGAAGKKDVGEGVVCDGE